MNFRTLSIASLLSLVISTAAFAQSFAGSVHISVAQWSEFDDTDYGIGGRFTWTPVSMIGVDADVTWYPSDYAEQIAFSRSRLEGLFGVTVGPRMNRVRPFVKAGAGFLKVGQTGGAFACIAIFPPPLACLLAGGDTLPAYEVGGGFEVNTSAKSFVRADIADRLLNYPGPTLDMKFERRDEGFIGHALRFTIGGGIRF